MYTILNKVDNTTAKFDRVVDAANYLKKLKNNYECATKEEIRILCNIFAKYKNNIAIDGIS